MSTKNVLHSFMFFMYVFIGLRGDHQPMCTVLHIFMVLFFVCGVFIGPRGAHQPHSQVCAGHLCGRDC